MRARRDGALRVEAFRENDFDAVFNIYRATMRAHVERAFGWDDTFQRDNMRKTSSASGTLVARLDGTIIAFAMTRLKEKALELFLLCVDPAHQRCGVGARLVAEIELKICAAAPLVGGVLPGNDVVGFYDKVGFETRPRADGGVSLIKRLTPATPCPDS